MNPIRFTKMHGLGNDFVVINALHQHFFLPATTIQHLAHRHTGIGFDQLLIIESKPNENTFFCRIFNSDGSEAKQCGNGLRCVARYIHEEKLATNKDFNLETIAGRYPIQFQDYEHISVVMGAPILEEPLIEVVLDQSKATIKMSILTIGNPHAVIALDDFESLQGEVLSQEISRLSHFPEGVNVGFMQIVSPSYLKLRTFERGAGETLACGSNACAAVVAGIANEWLQSPVTVAFKHGSLLVEWKNEQSPILMTGPAARVFDAELSSEMLASL